MNKKSNRNFLKRAVNIGCALGLAASTSLHAQTNQTEQILRGVIGNMIKDRQVVPASPQPQGMPDISELVGKNSAPRVAEANPLYSNKQDALNAVKAGRFIFREPLEKKERAAIRETLITIFRVDYGVPNVPQGCVSSLTVDSIGILASIASLNMATLSDVGPDFYQSTEGMSFTENKLKNLLFQQTSDLFQDQGCDLYVMGRVQLHPYRAALVKFSQEYAKAVQVYVSSERAQRKQTYEVAQATSKQQQQQRADEERRVVQQRIDAENKRIQDEQARRARIERARISG